MDLPLILNTFDEKKIIIIRTRFKILGAKVPDFRSNITETFRPKVTDQKWNETDLDQKLFLWRTNQMVHFDWQNRTYEVQIQTEGNEPLFWRQGTVLIRLKFFGWFFSVWTPKAVPIFSTRKIQSSFEAIEYGPHVFESKWTYKCINKVKHASK